MNLVTRRKTKLKTAVKPSDAGKPYNVRACACRYMIITHTAIFDRLCKCVNRYTSLYIINHIIHKEDKKVNYFL